MSCLNIKVTKIGGCNANASIIGKMNIVLAQICKPSFLSNYLYLSDNILEDTNNEKFILKKRTNGI